MPSPTADRARFVEFAEYINALKLERGCADCGYREHPAALQFDHVRGEKLFPLSAGRHRARRLVLAEIEKCDVVCANCHAIRTVTRGYSGGGHLHAAHSRNGLTSPGLPPQPGDHLDP